MPATGRPSGSPSKLAVWRNAQCSRRLRTFQAQRTSWRAVVGEDAASGVVDARCRVFGYRNLIVCDGAAMPPIPASIRHSPSRRWRNMRWRTCRPSAKPEMPRCPQSRWATCCSDACDEERATSPTRRPEHDSPRAAGASAPCAAGGRPQRTCGCGRVRTGRARPEARACHNTGFRRLDSNSRDEMKFVKFGTLLAVTASVLALGACSPKPSDPAATGPAAAT